MLLDALLRVYWPALEECYVRVVLSDMLGGKDVVEGCDGLTDERMCWIVIGRIHVKTELHAQICFYILPLINIVG
jgi:hypothetical protein